MVVEFRPTWLKSSRQPSHLDAMYSRDVARGIPLYLPTFQRVRTRVLGKKNEALLFSALNLYMKVLVVKKNIPSVSVRKTTKGAMYIGLPSLSLALQRCRRHLYPITIAETGASIEVEITYSSGVVATLEKGCFGHALLRCEDRSLATR